MHARVEDYRDPDHESLDFEALDPDSHLSDEDAEIPHSVPLQYNRIKEGTGPESKQGSPDRYDYSAFERYSVAYARLRLLGYHGINIHELVHVRNIIENFLGRTGIRLTGRNRAAPRRKPNAFHWIDENW
jgi:hypothetical protein